MIKLTGRDIKIKEFLKTVVVADTNTICTLFFNGSKRATQQRLRILVEHRYIKCFRESILEQNIYYLNKKPSSWKHKIVFSKLVGKLKEQNIEVLKYVTPLKVGNVIADGFIAIRINEEVNIYLVEVELTKYFDVNKYLDMWYKRKYKEKFPVMPRILVITDKKVKKDSVLDITVCKLGFENLKVR